MFGPTKASPTTQINSNETKTNPNANMISSKWDWSEADRTTQFAIGVAIGVIILVALFGNL